MFLMTGALLSSYLVVDMAVKFKTEAEIVKTARKLLNVQAISLKYQAWSRM